MTPEAQRIAIAEFRGFKHFTKKGTGHINQIYAYALGQIYLQPIPDYCNNLNAIQAALDSLTEAQLNKFCDLMCDEANDGTPDPNIGYLFRLKAPMWAEMYVRAIGKWVTTPDSPSPQDPPGSSPRE